MQTIGTFVRKYPVQVFFALAYGLAWMVWIPLMSGNIPAQTGAFLILLGAFAPSISGILLAALTGGAPAVKTLLGRALKWRVSLVWYFIALFGVGAIILLSIGAYAAVGGDIPKFEMLQKYALLLPLLFIQVTLMNGPLQEEFGWRGFALDELQKRHSPLTAGVVIGLLWGLWHLPLFGVSYSSQAGIPLVTYLLYHIPLTVIMVWLVNQAEGSLLIALLFHTSINVWGILLPLLPKAAGTERILDIAVALMWLAAIGLVLAARRTLLAHAPVRSMKTMSAT